MATVTIPPTDNHEQRFVIRNVSWQTYESLLADHVDASSPRFTYCEGTLEIMSPSNEHERLNRTLAAIAALSAEGLEIDFEALGSTTFRRQDIERGTEPDSCFYMTNLEIIRGKEQINLATDPPPDLVIEVEVTMPVIPKLPVYAQLGGPEIWVHDGRAPRILRLESGGYVESDRSGVLPSLTVSTLTEFLEKKRTLNMLAWRRMVRSWASAPR